MSKVRIIDLSHTIEDGLITYKGLPAPIICDYLSREASQTYYEEGTTFQIGKIEMVSNTGTYIDCPFHRYEDGKDLHDTEIERFVDLETIVIRADHKKHGPVLDLELFYEQDLRGKAVLINTNWDRHWNTDTYYADHPYLTQAAAEYLKQQGAKLVGIDSYNVDDTHHNSRPVHSILLREEILIVEHLTRLDLIPEDGSITFSAIPPRIKGMGTFPVRAYCKLG